MNGSDVGPLADVRVIAVEQFGAGPWATLQLADLGADVIKVEDPHTGGDIGRYVPPFREGEDALYFEAFNRGKRSISLDLNLPEGRDVLTDLVAVSDAVFANLRGESFNRLGLAYADLAPFNPRIVCCSLSGFGRDGPRSSEGAYDHVVQALSGWMSLTGEPDAPPARSGVSMADYAAGYLAALAILAGMWQVRRTGRGCDFDLSLFEVALAQLNYLATWNLSQGYAPARVSRSAHQSVVPFQTFRTRDGWIVIAAPKEHLWQSVARTLNLTELVSDERFDTFEHRRDHRDALVTALEERLGQEDTHIWLERLTAEGVPCSAINDVAGAFADPQAVARGVVAEVEHPVLGTVRHVSSPLRLASRPPSSPRLAPRRAEHQQAVLAEVCGYGKDRIQALAGAGAFGAVRDA